MKDELKPCPFCGSKATLHGGPEWVVMCNRLGDCMGHRPNSGGYTYRNDAIERWNTRPQQTVPLEHSQVRESLIECGVKDHIAGAIASILCNRFHMKDQSAYEKRKGE